MSQRRHRAWVALAILGAALLLALGYAASWKRPTPIRIAFANSLTGPTSAAGAESLAAVNLYIDEVNRKGGVDQGDCT
jgi:branched-chain amino acid transport system substrate-binding protein